MRNHRNSLQLRNLASVRVFERLLLAIGGRIKPREQTGEKLYYFPNDPKPACASARSKETSRALISRILKCINSISINLNPNLNL